MKKLILYLFFFFPIHLATNAQVSINSIANTYSEDFNTLANTGTSTILPTGWQLFESGTNANTNYAADDGTINSGNTYSFGATSGTERAFGTILSGSLTSTIGVQFINNSAITITTISISYTGEQWRLGTLSRTDRLDFQYSTTATSLTTGTWTDQDALDFTAPVTTGTIGALVGNSVSNRTTLTATITGLSIAPGSIFWFRWSDLNATGADDGLGVDDITVGFNGFTAPPCTEPTSQPTAITLTPASTTINGTFAAANPVADEYLIIRSTLSALSAQPTDATVYNNSQSLGGGVIVSGGTATSFTDNGLTPNVTYYYFIYALNTDGCAGGPNYLITSPLSASTTTLPLAICVAPTNAPTNIILTPANTTVSGNFTAAAGANRYLVVRSTSSSLSVLPSNGTAYTANQALGNGTVVSFGTATTFTSTGLTTATTYYYFVFAANGDCSGEPFYNTNSLNGTTTTTNSTTGIPPGYYNAAAGLTCAPLKTALYNIISSNTVQLTYTPGVWDAYLTTDLHRNDANTADIIWDIYTDNPAGPEVYTFNPSTNRCGNYSGEGDCYNREHSFPQSWFGSGAYPMYSDLHHLFPTDGFANAKHANLPYSEIGSPTYTSTNGSQLGTNVFPGFSGDAFEPIDAYKGDIARAILYMVTRYENLVAGWQNNSNANQVLSGNTYPALDDWHIKLLFKWHNEDPVSTKEINRNNAIYGFQNNRNPYVDHPEYVALVFQCTGLLPVTLIDFKAVKNSNTVNLNWTAAAETNFKNYEIERSTDGFVFTKTGVVAGQNIGNYTFIDNRLPNAKHVFYRLKMVDIDGKFSYSKTVSVRLGNISKIILYPNPTNGPLTVLLKQALAATGKLMLTDVTGRILLTQNINAAQTTMSMNVKHLPPGRYFIQLQSSEDFIRESFVITN